MTWLGAQGCAQTPEAGTDQEGSSLEPPEGARPRGHLDFGLVASRSLRDEISTVSSPGQVAAVTTAPAVTREDWSEAYSWGSCSVRGQNPRKPPRGKCAGGPEEPTATTPPLHWWVRQRSGNGSRCLAEASACSVLPRPRGSPPCHQPSRQPASQQRPRKSVKFHSALGAARAQATTGRGFSSLLKKAGR